ncbi:DUF262 domain-containing protein [Aliarcobacter butzleri]
MENSEEINYFEDKDEIKDDEELEIPKEIRRLNIETHDYPIEVLVKKIQDKDIILRPHYQRDFIWDRTKCSLLIESILLNIPLPPVYLAEEDDGSLSVIDGLQRLHTFLDYFENKFSLTKMEGEGLVELNKLTYSGLQKDFPKAKRILNKGNIRTITISKDSDPDIKYDIFERLNSGSVKLNDQEIRNCIFHGKLNDAIMGTYNLEKQIYNNNGLRHNKVIQQSMNLAEAHPRYLDAEVVIRILAMMKYHDNLQTKYKNSMKLLINDYMKEHKNSSDNDINLIKTEFENTMDKVFSIFDDRTFKRYSNTDIEKTLNRSIMDCVVVTFKDRTKEELLAKKNEIVELMNTMLNDKENKYIGTKTSSSFRDLVTKWTSSKNVLKDRLELWSLNFNNLMDN